MPAREDDGRDRWSMLGRLENPRMAPDHPVTTIEQLGSLYGTPPDSSLVKEIDYVHPHYAALIAAAPFVAISTCGPEGLDCSPRGDAPGFVHVHDDKTLMIPDRRGNNRIDTLKNLVRDPRVSLLFLIPGIGETLRVNGRAAISADPALRTSFAVDGKAPTTVIVVTVERIYFQCAKAVVRSKIWDASRHVERQSLPSTGTILAALSDGKVGGDAYDKELPTRHLAQLY
jgi:PPOX class probable FMN-dependent enzyme